MSTTVPQRLNDRLEPVLDTGDEVYKTLISDPGGVPESAIINPGDLNHGVLASLLEYLDDLKNGLIAQLRIDQAEGPYVLYHVYELLDEVRFDAETDAEMVARIIGYYHDPKVSNATIQNIANDFSGPGPAKIIRTMRDQLFCDVGFCDTNDPSFRVASGIYDGLVVTPGYTGGPGSTGAYTFTIILENYDPLYGPLLFELLDRWVAAGIEVEVLTVTVA